MKKVTGRKPNTQTTQKSTRNTDDSLGTEQTQQKEVEQQYSRKVMDYLGKATGFKIITDGMLNMAIIAVILLRIWFAIYTNNPYLLTPEAVPSQIAPEAPLVVPEIPKVQPEIHLTV